MRTIIDLPDAQITALATLEAKRKVSRAQLVREAISYFLQSQPAEESAFGAWKDSSKRQDGVLLQQQLRAEWER